MAGVIALIPALAKQFKTKTGLVTVAAQKGVKTGGVGLGLLKGFSELLFGGFGSGDPERGRRELATGLGLAAGAVVPEIFPKTKLKETTARKILGKFGLAPDIKKPLSPEDFKILFPDLEQDTGVKVLRERPLTREEIANLPSDVLRGEPIKPQVGREVQVRPPMPVPRNLRNEMSKYMAKGDFAVLPDDLREMFTQQELQQSPQKLAQLAEQLIDEPEEYILENSPVVSKQITKLVGKPLTTAQLLDKLDRIAASARNNGKNLSPNDKMFYNKLKQMDLLKFKQMDLLKIAKKQKIIGVSKKMIDNLKKQSRRIMKQIRNTPVLDTKRRKVLREQRNKLRNKINRLRTDVVVTTESQRQIRLREMKALTRRLDMQAKEAFERMSTKAAEKFARQLIKSQREEILDPLKESQEEERQRKHFERERGISRVGPLFDIGLDKKGSGRRLLTGLIINILGAGGVGVGLTSGLIYAIRRLLGDSPKKLKPLRPPVQPQQPRIPLTPLGPPQPLIPITAPLPPPLDMTEFFKSLMPLRGGAGAESIDQRRNAMRRRYTNRQPGGQNRMIKTFPSLVMGWARGQPSSRLQEEVKRRERRPQPTRKRIKRKPLKYQKTVYGWGKKGAKGPKPKYEKNVDKYESKRFNAVMGDPVIKRKKSKKKKYKKII